MISKPPANLTKRLGLVLPRKWDPGSEENINGPTLVEFECPLFPKLRLYLMYFGHHKGKYIRVAWAFSPTGPFRRVPLVRPLLLRDRFGERKGHVASPEVRTVGGKRYMFAHSPSRHFRPGKQITYMSRLRLGVVCSRPKPIDLPSYARFFSLNGDMHAITNGADVFKLDSNSLETRQLDVDKSRLLVPESQDVIERVRHPQILAWLGHTLCFYTRVGDAPERVFVSLLEAKNPEEIMFSTPIELLRPREDYEGAHHNIEPSKSGISRRPENALRDPFVGEFGGQHFLYYSTAGEKGIACAELDVANLCAALKSGTG